VGLEPAIRREKGTGILLAELKVLKRSMRRRYYLHQYERQQVACAGSVGTDTPTMQARCFHLDTSLSRTTAIANTYA
jgi:hypothetical protein